MSFSFPDWLEPHLLEDSVMADAYAAVPDDRRALLKTAIARLWEWYGPSRCTGQTLERRLRGGFVAREKQRPVDFVVLVCGDAMASPAQVLAAVVPAIAAGVPHILAVKPQGQGWTQPQLVGLELAGVEQVAELGQGEIKRLLLELGSAGSTGRMVFVNALEAAALAGQLSPSVRPLDLDTGGVVVFEGDEQRFDLKAIAFAQAGTAMTYVGTASDVDDSIFVCTDGGFEAVLQLDARAAFLPAGLHSRAAERFHAVLGPGHESCWIWTEIDSNAFVDTRVCWSDGEV